MAKTGERSRQVVTTNWQSCWRFNAHEWLPRWWRTRISTPGAPAVEEEGSCSSALVRPDEACTEHERPDSDRTALAVAAAVGVVIAAALAVNYVDNHCPFC